MSDNGLKKNGFAKFICALIFSISAVTGLLGAAFLSAAADFGMITQDGYDEDADYLDSYHVKYSTRNTALYTVDANVPLLLEGSMGDTDPDYLYRITERDGNEIFSSFGKENPENVWTYEIDVDTYENKDGELVYWLTRFADSGSLDTVEHSISGPETGNIGTDRIFTGTKQYTVDIGVAEHPDIHSGLGRQLYVFNATKKHLRWYVPVTIVSVLTFLASAAFTIWSSGWKKGFETPQNSILGRVPFDVLTLILCGLCTCAAAGFYVLGDFFGVRMLEMPFCAYALALMGLFALMIWIWFSEIITRIRTGSLLKHNVITYLIVWMWKLCRDVLSWVYQHMLVPAGNLLKQFGRLPLVWKTAYLGIICYIALLTSLEANRTWGFPLFLLIAAALFIIVMGLRYFIGISTVSDMTKKIAAGEYPDDLPERLKKLHAEPFRTQISSLAGVSSGLKKAVDEAMRSEHLKTELITNVSHDIKTPLTSIINYADLLQKEPSEEERKEYTERIYKQSLRLKKLTEDLVEASKASTGNISADLSPVYVREIIEQSLAEYDEKFSLMSLEVITEADKDLKAMADGRLLWRVMSNLLSNVSKYALPGTRVYIDAVPADGGNVRITIRNISAEPLNISSEELKERFVRGDSSRHTEGSGLGLNIAESLVHLMNGQLNIIIDGDLFKCEILLPRA